MANDPRKLVEITEYRNLLNEQDEVQEVVDVIASQTAEQLANNVTTASTFSVRNGTTSVSKASFNKHLAGYIKANIATIAPAVLTYMEAIVASNKAEAEAEAGLLGMTTTATTILAPEIISDAAVNATVGEAFSYDIVADNDSGTGITSCVYSATGAPAWLTVNTSTGAITGTVPADATVGDSFTMTVKVTTNGGEDSQDVVVTYVAAASEPEEEEEEPGE